MLSSDTKHFNKAVTKDHLFRQLILCLKVMDRIHRHQFSPHQPLGTDQPSIMAPGMRWTNPSIIQSSSRLESCLRRGFPLEVWLVLLNRVEQKHFEWKNWQVKEFNGFNRKSKQVVAFVACFSAPEFGSGVGLALAMSRTAGRTHTNSSHNIPQFNMCQQPVDLTWGISFAWHMQNSLLVFQAHLQCPPRSPKHGYIVWKIKLHIWKLEGRP